jgi:hypothetical protein
LVELKLTFFISGLALIFIIIASPFAFSQYSVVKECDQESLGQLFLSKKTEQITTPIWKIIESNLTPGIKDCILEKIKIVKGIKTVDEKRLLYLRQEYTMISNGVVDAIASDFGYAAVYASTNTGLQEKKRVEQKRLIKLSFSVEFDGTVNIHNIFEIMSVNNHIVFLEHFDKKMIDKSNECLHCHHKSTQPLKILGRYKTPFIQTQRMTPSQLEKHKILPVNASVRNTKGIE